MDFKKVYNTSNNIKTSHFGSPKFNGIFTKNSSSKSINLGKKNKSMQKYERIDSFFRKINKSEEQEEELNFKVESCRVFAKKYLKLMTVLFAIIIMKRLFFDAEKNYHKIMYHISVIAFYFLAVRMHERSIYFTRFVPLFIGVLSYYAHTRYLNYYNFNTSNSQAQQFINMATSTSSGQYYNFSAGGQTINPNYLQAQNLNADINEVFRHIVIFGALFINHIYIDIFLTVTHFDSLILNMITWGLLSIYALFNNNLTIGTKISIMTLAAFAFKFSYDAKGIKDQVFKSYLEQKQLNLQWMNIFKRLPIGILITRDNRVIHSNKKMLEILGKDEINNLEELDETLHINQDEVSSLFLRKDCGSFRNILDQSSNKKYGGIKKMLGRVSKIRSDIMHNDQSQSEQLNQSSINSSDKKFKIGSDTYSFIFQKVKIMNLQINLILFIDQTQQEKLFAANLEKKYKNIFLSSVSHSLRTPLNSLQLNNNVMKEILKERPDAQELLDLDGQTHKLLNYQIDDVLDYSKLETDEFKVSMKSFKFKAFIRDICTIFESQAREKKLSFGCVFVKDIPTEIYQDSQRLGQVLVNMLGNAIKFTSEGFVRMIIDTLQKDNRHFLKIKIQDTGKGISSDQQIGQWFSNLEVKENVNQNGIGFGINISKRLINKLGGELFIENNSTTMTSELEKGVTVTIEFPYRNKILEESVDMRFDDEFHNSCHLANSQYNLLSFHQEELLQQVSPEKEKELVEIDESCLLDNSILTKIKDHTPTCTQTLRQKVLESQSIDKYKGRNAHL
eukprot:403341417